MKTIDATYLLQLGFPESKAIGIALEICDRSEVAAGDAAAVIPAILKNPDAYRKDKVWGELAEALIPSRDETIALRDEPLPYKIEGADGIAAGALAQIDTAMRLPVARAGALMPDAHPGYGLPIGGVLATENTVIPYAVGVDIGCRMCLSVFDQPLSELTVRGEGLKKMLMQNTAFGREAIKPKYRKEHAVLENNLFDEIPLIERLKDKAATQLGSSGGGNHFVEFGVVELSDLDNELGLEPGKYLALLSHSGSRGLGATIARHYTGIAMEQCKLPKEARHLAWLDLNTEAGQEYWLAMNLAGDYASACHHQIHERIASDMGAQIRARVENHHNFAWKEQHAGGHEWIVHRKGATPAGKGELGVIPGSMTAPGYIVRGKGNALSLHSAAHGAGRRMSRTEAKKTIDAKAIRSELRRAGVEVIGSGLDEAPAAYKNIVEVMEAQKELVEVLGTFTPKIVRMCGDPRFHEVD